MDHFTGGCLCGDVRIVATGRPYRVGICHCLDCRKHHGALFHTSGIFPENAVTVEGEAREFRGRYFCPRCGSSVFGRSGDEVEVNLGALDAAGKANETTAENYKLDLRSGGSIVKEAEKIPFQQGRSDFLLNCWIETLCTAEARVLGWLYKEFYGQPFSPR